MVKYNVSKPFPVCKGTCNDCFHEYNDSCLADGKLNQFTEVTMFDADIFIEDGNLPMKKVHLLKLKFPLLNRQSPPPLKINSLIRKLIVSVLLFLLAGSATFAHSFKVVSVKYEHSLQYEYVTGWIIVQDREIVIALPGTRYVLKTYDKTITEVTRYADTHAWRATVVLNEEMSYMSDYTMVVKSNNNFLFTVVTKKGTLSIKATLEE